MVIEIKKFFHTIKYLPCQWKIIFDSTFFEYFVIVKLKELHTDFIFERKLALSHCKDIKEKLIAFKVKILYINFVLSLI